MILLSGLNSHDLMECLKDCRQVFVPWWKRNETLDGEFFTDYWCPKWTATWHHFYQSQKSPIQAGFLFLANVAQGMYQHNLYWSQKSIWPRESQEVQRIYFISKISNTIQIYRCFMIPRFSIYSYQFPRYYGCSWRIGEFDLWLLIWSTKCGIKKKISGNIRKNNVWFIFSIIQKGERIDGKKIL